MDYPISITAMASVSALGTSLREVWESYKNPKHLLIQSTIGNQNLWVSPMTKKAKSEVEKLQNSETRYKNLDPSVLYAIYASRKAVAMAGWTNTSNFGVNIGSSRGATSLFEYYHKEFVERESVGVLTSPTTTLGNISSWVAHDLETKGPNISHSITCSTALHAVLNGIAWIKAGMAKTFLVGGSEAPLTPFTLAQMQALKIYADNEHGSAKYPCRSLDFEKNRNTMVLGEGAAMACLEKGENEKRLACIIGVGYATEPLTHNISISTDAQCFQESMKMALNGLSPDSVDVMVLHAPGTIKGDLAEKRAVDHVFCNKMPYLTTNKWKVGHTFGASGMLSLELGVLMLQHQKFISNPFIHNSSLPKEIRKVMINAVGFGGNAVSVLLSS